MRLIPRTFAGTSGRAVLTSHCYRESLELLLDIFSTILGKLPENEVYMKESEPKDEDRILAAPLNTWMLLRLKPYVGINF